MAAFVLAGSLAFATPAAARQDDTRLGDLFNQLRTAPTDSAADAIEDQIWTIWLDYPGREVLTLMHAGVQLLHKDDYTEAVALFGRITTMAPDYAEGWNKRANAHYLLGNYPAAVADIGKTLALEPRHFAALAGLGLVYLAIDEPAGALKAFEAALAINPHMTGVRDQVDKLRKQLAGAAL
ncbi:tetratricopeptide repeat protein [Azospirillum sp. TSO22-1]|uniref:tetratricopeptide repeat protein n=1 Tax=Azospirillum sp. TSO22-1 TaxID=716789 RepID=UPI001FFE903E|nr:tetratricopeptide repeat protein [Azospirillum sp. TSO22-1]